MEDDKQGSLMNARLKQTHSQSMKDFETLARRNFPFFKHNYLKHLPADRSSRILEVGSGFGQFLSFAQSVGFTNVLGIDLSSENVKYCRSHGLEVKLADVVEFLRDTDETFQAIVMNDVIEHLKEEQLWEFLRLAKERLAPGGALIIKTYNLANPIMGLHSRYINFTHETGWTEESMRQVLDVAGFASIEVLPSRLYVYYYNPLNYIGLLIEKAVGFLLRMYFIANARKTTTFFTKNLIAVARAPARN
jgi:2-polyprenyl-3-methyl-5-hydroxy-6-metoxy-1,4-benzoquinol methylase